MFLPLEAALRLHEKDKSRSSFEIYETIRLLLVEGKIKARLNDDPTRRGTLVFVATEFTDEGNSTDGGTIAG
jgi:hypothetical protein